MAFDKEIFRPFLVQILSKDYVDKLLGVQPEINKVEMPMIPSINKDATNTKYVRLVDPNSMIFDANQKRAYDFQFLSEIYLVTRLTAISDQEQMTWLNNLNQGGTREGIYRAIVLDSVYSELESQKISLNEKQINFIITFLKKYLEKDISREKLMAVNFFRAKRYVVDQFLDVFDSFDNINDIYDWYALFSQDMAMNYPEFWQLKVRQDTSANTHLIYAKKVPLGFIKSEFMIKIHKALNLLRN